MAESGAHLSSASLSSESVKPSIFEVLAQESLLSALKPALKHVLRIAAERNPARYSRLYQRCDEVYAVLQLILESYYLKKFNAAFSENFYGLRRVKLSADDSVESNKGLTFIERLRSLLLLILAPYIKNKLDQCYERLSETSDQLQHGLRGRLCQTFLYAYPLVHAAWEGSVFYFQLLYIIGRASCHSPFLRIAGLRLRSLNEDELSAADVVLPSLSVLLANRSVWEQLNILISKSLAMASLALSTSLSVSVFFLQFLDWWYTSDRRAVDVMALPNPGPPPKYDVDKRYQLANVCPLCNKLRTNDTALSVSGFVFCYPCILKYVKEKSCCPITGYPSQPDHLVRLYQTDN